MHRPKQNAGPIRRKEKRLATAIGPAKGVTFHTAAHRSTNRMGTIGIS